MKGPCLQVGGGPLSLGPQGSGGDLKVYLLGSREGRSVPWVSRFLNCSPQDHHS